MRSTEFSKYTFRMYGLKKGTIDAKSIDDYIDSLTRQDCVYGRNMKIYRAEIEETLGESTNNPDGCNASFYRCEKKIIYLFFYRERSEIFATR